MRKPFLHLAVSATLLAGSLGVATSALAHHEHAPPPAAFPGAYPPIVHSHHDYGMTRRQAYHAGLHDIAANFHWVDRNHDGLVTRAEIAAFRHWQARHHWHYR